MVLIVPLIFGLLASAAVSAVTAGFTQGSLFAGAAAGGQGLLTASSIFNVGAAITQGVTTLVVGGLSRFLAPDEKGPTGGSLDRTRTIRSSIAPRRYVYGNQAVGGIMAYGETNASLPSGGENNGMPSPSAKDARVRQGTGVLHLILIIGEGPIDSVQEIQVDNKAVDFDSNGVSKNFQNRIFKSVNLGDDDQTVDGEAQGAIKPWTSDHRLRGIAHVYLAFSFNNEVFDGMPNVRIEVKGKDNITDTRDDTTGYTVNPALITNDFLRITQDEGGVGADADEIDQSTVDTAANTCEEQVNSQDRYTTNTVIQLNRRPADILGELVGSMAGKLFYSEGDYHMKAGEWTSPVTELDDDDLIGGGFELQTRFPKSDLFNGVKGKYVDPNNEWQPSDFPAVTGGGTYKTEDGGERLWKDIELPSTIHAEEASRIARIILERKRLQKTFTATYHLHSAIELQAGDNVEITHDRFDWDKKTFEVVQWQLNFIDGDDPDAPPTPAIQLQLRESDSTVFNTVNEAAIGLKSPALEF